MICRGFWRFMLHTTYASIHVDVIETLNPVTGFDGPDVKWKKLWSRGKYGVYWRVT